jgi:hypothetical protein
MRQPTHVRTPSSVRLPTRLREQLVTAAQVEGRSFSSVVRATLERGLVARAGDQQVVREALGQTEPRKAA